MADRDNQQIKPPQAKNNMPAKLKSDDIPALFWDEMPDDPDNPDMAAIQAIIDESTPEERAISFKVYMFPYYRHTHILAITIPCSLHSFTKHAAVNVPTNRPQLPPLSHRTKATKH
jgi:hypothetical protein